MLVLTGGALFNLVFWQEKLAVNLLIFDAFILASIFCLYPFSLSNRSVGWLMLGHLITLSAVIIHNTELSKLACATTLMLIIAFVQYEHRSVWYAVASALANYILMIPSFFKCLSSVPANPIQFYVVRKLIRLAIIPAGMTVVFYLIYSSSNDVFQAIMGDAERAIQQFFDKILDWFAWQRVGFWLLGFFITGGLLLQTGYLWFSKRDMVHKDQLVRRKHNFKRWKASAVSDLLSLIMGRFAWNNLALKSENSVGLLSLVLLNALLLVVNAIDIIYVWFGHAYRYSMNLTDYVHEGTWTLIFSIVLAMSILLFFFRGNLNFYQKNKWLRYGAYGWILQNTILVISVTLRDLYYIRHMGLAYKRIGVLFFLFMVLSGLLTAFLKISKPKTTYYLLRVNAWVGVALFVLASCVHWDELIAGYNLNNLRSIPLDAEFLLSLSDKSLPVIEKNKEVLSSESRQVLFMREKQFFNEQKNYSWLSWNYADSYVKNKLGELSGKHAGGKN